MKHAAVTVTFALGVLCAGTALANDRCRVSMAHWQPRHVVQEMAQSRGWAVRGIKTDNGCYEIEALDANGNEIEAILNPATLDILAPEGETARDDDAKAESGTEDGSAGDEAAGSRVGISEIRAPSNNGLFKGNSRPAVVAK